MARQGLGSLALFVTIYQHQYRLRRTSRIVIDCCPISSEVVESLRTILLSQPTASNNCHLPEGRLTTKTSPELISVLPSLCL